MAKSLSSLDRAKQYAKLEKLETASDLVVLKHTQKTQKIIYRSYLFWVFVLGGLVVYLITKYLYIRSKYKYIIGQMQKAIDQGSQFEISPFFIALSIEYPFLSSFRIGNPSLPLAIEYAYTSSAIAPTMGTGYDASKSPPRDYLSEMLQISKDCGYRMSDAGNCSAMFIICRLFRDCDRADCFPACPSGSTPGNAAYMWTSGIAGPAATWGMAGSMLGPEGAIIGGIAGAIFGGLTTDAAERERKKKCNKIRKNCYLAPGESFNCPL